MHAFFLSFLTVASLQFLALIAPGPDFALVTRNALLYPRRESIYTAVGISLGLSIHISYCIFGIAIIIAHSIVVFKLLKYLGAAYLIYIGLKSWRTPTSSSIHPVSNLKGNPRISACQAVQQGFLCNLLNPKASLFFLGLFALVIKPTTPLWQQGIYGLWMVLTTFTWFSCLACFITRPTTQQKIQRIQPIAVKTLGILLILMGVALLFLSLDHYATH